RSREILARRWRRRRLPPPPLERDDGRAVRHLREYGRRHEVSGNGGCEGDDGVVGPDIDHASLGAGAVLRRRWRPGRGAGGGRIHRLHGEARTYRAYG